MKQKQMIVNMNLEKICRIYSISMARRNSSYFYELCLVRNPPIMPQFLVYWANIIIGDSGDFIEDLRNCIIIIYENKTEFNGRL